MWHVSAPHRPCIGHRTGYSLHENARISGLASADFEGVFAHSYKRWRPGFFYARCARNQVDGPFEDFASGQPKASCEWAAKHILRWAKHSFAGEQPDCMAK